MQEFYETIPLSVNKAKLYIENSKIEQEKNELEQFISDNKYMNSKEFSKNVLFTQEIKANNTIEGYTDDIGLIYDIIKNKLNINDKTKMARILNLYNGYKFIFKNKEINKESLKTLYSILSKDLLEEYDVNNMGKYYRNKPVYIYYSANLDVFPDMGMDSEYIDKYMNEYFEYVNSNNNLNTLTDYYIKSQVMHFQFVNIHPFFDINGRTARTVSMWYLLNNKVYPYIIFNRAISLSKTKYYKVIRKAKQTCNVTYFLKFMLDNVRIELEKEYIMEMIKSSSSGLTPIDYQTIYYILSMNGILTARDFCHFYNLNNDKKKVKEIYENMIIPLLDKNIIIILRETDKFINDKDKNFIFKLNEDKYEVNPNKIKKLKL